MGAGGPSSILGSPTNMIKIIKTPLSIAELKESRHERYDEMIKAVVDIELGLMAVGGEFHADEEAILLERGSKQENLWGINIHFEKMKKEERIEFDSMINIRPRQGNRSRNVENEEIKKQIIVVVDQLLHE